MVPTLYQIDAFTDRPFAGNPAAVVSLVAFPDDGVLQSIAAENNLSETAFIRRSAVGYSLRWFTPLMEVPLCGHGTLAAAVVVMERIEPHRSEVIFETASGPLLATRMSSAYTLELPSRPSTRVEVPITVAKSLGIEPLEVWADRFNYLVILENAECVKYANPKIDDIAQLDRSGVIITAPGIMGIDFVSRYFAPRKGIPEDPVSGAAHCMLAPYWSNRLKRSTLHAHQLSRRGGYVTCCTRGDRVVLTGQAVFVFEAELSDALREMLDAHASQSRIPPSHPTFIGKDEL